MNIEAIITHFVCILIGGMLGVTAMAVCSAGGRDDYYEVTNSKCKDCPYEHDDSCPADYTYCWKDRA